MFNILPANSSENKLKSGAFLVRIWWISSSFFVIVLLSAGFFGCTSINRYNGGEDGIVKNKVYERGIASYYADKFHGKLTASGVPYDMHALTAAHPDLPFGTVIEVTNLTNGLTVLVTINDRFPGTKGRIIDLSLAAAKSLHMIGAGIAEVEIRVVK